MLDGIKSPKFIGSDNHEVTLDFVDVMIDEPDYRVLETESELDCVRDYFGRGYHWNYKIKINLYKYFERYGIPVKTKYDEIITYLFDEVTLYRHRDAIPFMNSSSAVVPFFIYQIIPIYIERKEFRDGLIIDFRSTMPVDHKKSTEEPIVSDDEGDLAADDSGAILS
jgi:hypothetical protein